MQSNRNPTTDGRPLTARSIVASTLLGVRPPELPPAALVRAGEIFGIAEGTTRVALSRMLAAGELATADGAYTLSGRLLDRMTRQDASRRPPLRRWDGAWRTAVVTAEKRTAAERADLRAAMRELRFAELREGVWMRPDNLAGTDLAHAREVADEQCVWMRSSVEDPSDVAAELWDLESWARRAEMLRRRMRTSLREPRGPVPACAARGVRPRGRRPAAHAGRPADAARASPGRLARTVAPDGVRRLRARLRATVARRTARAGRPGPPDKLTAPVRYGRTNDGRPPTGRLATWPRGRRPGRRPAGAGRTPARARRSAARARSAASTTTTSSACARPRTRPSAPTALLPSS